MRVLYAASEVAGFAKTGGLADVAGSLPRALTERGIDCAVILPMYRSARQAAVPMEPTGLTIDVPLGQRLVHGSVWRSQLPAAKGHPFPVPVFLIEQPELFERDDPALGRGLYQVLQPDGARADYTDNSARYGFFCQAVLEAMRLLDFWPHVVHINDWQTGLIPVYLRELYRHARSPYGARYAAVKVLCTIHNLAYQGLFWHFDMPLLSLPWRLFNFDELEFYGRINFLKAGIVFSDMLTTVSPTYAREIQTHYFGCGLQGVLLQRSSKLCGIVNGVDYEVWNPATDPHIAVNYDDSDVTQGKAACKAALQQQCGLDQRPDVPLLGTVSRLVDQKGLDLFVDVAEKLIERDVQLVILGEGDPRYHEMLAKFRAAHPRSVGLSLTQDETLAHRIEAGADLFLMPSLYEPCGLNQLYSLKYGTLPLVRATGGLADTVVDATPENLAAGRATGFSFVTYTPAALFDTVNRALTMYREEPQTWLNLQRTGMRQDWSWNRSAAEYERLFRLLTEN